MPYPMSLRALAVAGALCSLLSIVAAQTPRGAASAPPPIEPQQVRGWLARIHNAASQRNFQGTLIVSAGGAVSSARIAHFCEGPNQFERIESLDGQTRHMFRVNDVVHTLWPSKHVALVEQRELVSSFPALLQAGDDRVSEFYELRVGGSGRVAGLDASVLDLSPRDDHRFGYRLWAEKSTGLLLRADVVGERGELLETSAFSDITIGVKPQPDTVLAPMKKLDGYRIMRTVLQPASLEAEGWVLRHGVPGFKQVSCVKRPLEPMADGDGPTIGKSASQALQTIFSDGLTYVSVFIEPDSKERKMSEAVSLSGATQTLRSRRGDHWITVVGDVPLATLKAFASGLERNGIERKK